MHFPARRRPEVFTCLPVRPKLIVSLAFVRIRENFVGLVYLFEFFLGRFISGIYIGMVLARQRSVRLLDLILGRRVGKAKDFIIISKLNRHASL